MKSVYTFLLAVLTAGMLLFPLCAARGTDKAEVPAVSRAEVEETLKVLSGGEVKEMPVREYLFCTVAAEMPALYNAEALKAQTVAAYTYALFKTAANTGEEYDITADSSVDQAFITRSAAREKWGEHADEYGQKIDAAINAVYGEALYYENKPAMTVYTAISPGKTESAENVWGKSYPYLVSVESIGDMLCPDYLSEVSLPFAEVSEKLSPLGAGTDTSKYFSDCVYSDSGTLLSASFDGKTLSGKEVRKALSLRSACFEVAAADGAFKFTVRGYGHGVGMSQNGADYMAKQGSTYREILAWYYPGCEMVKK